METIKEKLMEYIGEKSLSSLLSRLLFWFWIFMLGLILVGIPLENIVLYSLFPQVEWIYSIADFMMIAPPEPEQTQFVKILLTLQSVVIAPALLILIKKLEKLFRNFAENKVFDKSNVKLLSHCTLLVLVFSIAALDLISFLIGVLLAILCAIFRHGVMLQEENDFTV